MNVLMLCIIVRFTMPDKHIILSFVIYCAVISLIEVSGESHTRIVVQVNNGSVSDGEEKVIYKVGDIIDFSCDGLDVKSDKHYGVVYKKDEINIKRPKYGNYETNSFVYSIKTYDFDDKSEVHCEVETWNKTINEYQLIDYSTAVTLVINSDNNFNVTIPEVQYSEGNPVIHICGPDDSLIVMTNDTRLHSKENQLHLAPSHTGSIIFCSEIHIERKPFSKNRKDIYTRIIYNQTKYTYTEVSSENLSSQVAVSPTQIGIIVGVLFIVCIALVASFVLYRSKRNRPNVTPSTDQDTNHDNCSTQLIYAELALSQAPRSGCRKSERTEESSYAEIAGFIGKMPHVIEESPYAEIIARK